MGAFLRRTAVHLALDKQGVEDPAAITDTWRRSATEPGLRIHLDDRDVRSEREHHAERLAIKLPANDTSR